MPNINPFKREVRAIVPAAPPENTDNWRVLDLWIRSRRSIHTQDAYRRDIGRLVAFTDNKPFSDITLEDLLNFRDSLANLAPASQARILSAVKSLLTFCCKAFPRVFDKNVGAAFELPKLKNTLAERILDEEPIHQMLAKENNQRNHALLRLMYSAGIRRAEIIGLNWIDLQAVTIKGRATGQIQVYGKGGKTRYIALTPGTWQELQRLRDSALYAKDYDPVFVSRQHTRLSKAQVNKIVRAAARKAGLSKPVSPHWLRHSHATHALARGAPISLVQATLGHENIQTTGKYLHARPDESSGQYLTI